MDDPMPAFEHKQLSQLIAERLRTDIIEGRLKPGDWLRQQQLAREYNSSQMPVREALKQLISDGLVEHVPFRGARIIKFTPEDVDDLYTLRAYMEGMAAKRAASSITPDELVELERLHIRMSQCVTPQEIREYRELNRRFHLLLFSACRRPLLVRILNQLWATFPVMLWSSFPKTAAWSPPDRELTDTEEHQAIIDALKARDPDSVERAVRHHIEESARVLTRVANSD